MDNPKHILIAEDEEALRTSLVEFFSSVGYVVHSAQDGSKAIELLSEHRFDAVLTDIRMPTKTGIDLLNRIERGRQKGQPSPKVIIMTGLLEEGEAYLKSLGASAVLEKPIRLQKVVQTVEEVLNQP